MSMFTDAAAALMTDLQGAAGIDMAYTRGATVLNIVGVPARSRRQGMDNNGAVIDLTSKDFIFRKSDLAALFPPKSGDTITSPSSEIYVVGPLSSGSTVYEQMNDEGANGTMLRIHVVRKTL